MMLSVNPNPTSVMSFKSKLKLSKKDLKAYKAMEEAHWHTIMSDSRISPEVKKNLLRNKIIAEVSQMSWFELLKNLLFKK